MGDARALLASLGTSALLVAAAATSLLTISFVFAMGGFDDSRADGSREALTFDSQGVEPKSGTDDTATADVLVTDRAPARGRREGRSRGRALVRREAAAATSPGSTSSQIALGAGASNAGGTGDDTPAAPATPSAQTAKPNLGDSVQDLGDQLSTTLQGTGSALGKLTAPLGRPVSAAVQQIVNAVAALLQQTTNGLGALLGAKPGT